MQKIYTRILIDMATGRTLEEKWHWHDGPVALLEGDGGGDGEGEGEDRGGDIGLGGGDVDVGEGGSEEAGSGDRGETDGGETGGGEPGGLGVGDFDTQTGNIGDPGIDVAETELGGPVGPGDPTGFAGPGPGGYGIDPLGGFGGWDESQELGIGYAPQEAVRPSGVKARNVGRTFAGFKSGTLAAFGKGMRRGARTAVPGMMAGAIASPAGMMPGMLGGFGLGFGTALAEEAQFDYSIGVTSPERAAERGEPGAGGEGRGYTPPAAEPAPGDGTETPPEEPTIPQEAVTVGLPGGGATWPANVYRPSLVALGAPYGGDDWWLERRPRPSLAEQRRRRRAA